MALVDKYGGKAPNEGLIAKYVGRKHRKRERASIQKVAVDKRRARC